MRSSQQNYSASEIDSAVIGQKLYKENCVSCHGEIGATAKRGSTPEEITWAISNIPQMRHIALSADQIRYISEALKVDMSICEVQDLPGYIPSSRLSHGEFNRAINNLFSINGNWVSGFPADNSAGFFKNESFSKQTNPVLVESYFRASAEIVDALFSSSQSLSKTVPCRSSENIACASEVVENLARRAFRRPISDKELANLLSPYNQTRSLGLDFDTALKASLRAIILNPNFLFKIYEETSNPVRLLNSSELATRLSFFLWGTLPDDQLLELVEKNTLTDPRVLNTQVMRMLADNKSEYLRDHFAYNWLDLDKIYDDSKKPDPSLFPNYSNHLRDEMIEETMLFIDQIVIEDKSPLDFILANYSYMNNSLAEHYGLGVSLTEDYQKVNLPADRSGLLTHASILTMTSNPNETSVVNRGIWAMERIICEKAPPDAPDGVDTNVPLEEGLSLRERLEHHRSNPSCVSCHSVMDPLGFGFENFGPVGQFRENWSDGYKVDASGELPSGESFRGVASLAQEISKSGKFQRCFAKHLLTFAATRTMGVNDQCTINRLGARRFQSNSKFSDLVLGVVFSDPFLRYQNEGVE